MNSICKPSRSASGARSIPCYTSLSPAEGRTILAKATLTTAEAATSDATTNGPETSETWPGFLCNSELFQLDRFEFMMSCMRWGPLTVLLVVAMCGCAAPLVRYQASHASLRPDQRLNNLPGFRLQGSDKGISAAVESDIADLADVRRAVRYYREDAYATWDDCISSIRVAPGWRAIVYSDKDFLGESLEITADVPNLKLVKGSCHGPKKGLNDCITSIRAWRRRPHHADVRVWSWLLSLFQRTGVPAQATRVTKPCDVTGCDGTMAFDDTEWPAYGTWVCDRDSGHRELLHGEWRPSVKACTFAGCEGVMTEG